MPVTVLSVTTGLRCGRLQLLPNEQRVTLPLMPYGDVIRNASPLMMWGSRPMTERHEHDLHAKAEREVHDGLPSHQHGAGTRRRRVRVPDDMPEFPVVVEALRARHHNREGAEAIVRAILLAGFRIVRGGSGVGGADD